MKYIVNYHQKIDRRGRTASSKARRDCNLSFRQCGYGREDLNTSFYNVPLLPNLQGMALHLGMMARIGRHNELYYQYPTSCKKSLPTVFGWLHALQCRVALIVHDVLMLRTPAEALTEKAIFQAADLLIVHTEAMKEWLSEHGVTTPMVVLGLFDYYSEDDFREQSDIFAHKNEIVFAGNLGKSAFLPKLSRHPFSHVTFQLYGGGGQAYASCSHMSYRGSFDSDHTAAIEGGWGLVWDGDSMATCSGQLGNYLRYNLPHKLSLYLAAGLPVIVWRQSAVANFIVSRHLGIAVDGLGDVEQAISRLTDDEYMKMIANCKDVGSQLRKGAMLKRIITEPIRRKA